MGHLLMRVCSEGLDMTYAFVNYLYGSEVVNPVMNLIEYAPHTNAEWDPFSVVWKVSDR